MKNQHNRRRGRSDTNTKTNASKDNNDGAIVKNQSKSKDAATLLLHNNNSLLIQLSEEEPTWFRYGHNLTGRNASITTNNHNTSSHQLQLVLKYRALADDIYQRQVQLASKKHSSKDDRWVESTMHSGTLKDRIASMSVLVSNDPIHKLYALDNLLNLATGGNTSGGGGGSKSKPNSRVAQLAAQALEDLFTNTLLPQDRKLVTLDQRPLHLYENTSKSLSPRILLMWRFEELIRDKYYVFIKQYLTKTLLSNCMELEKKFALRCATQLLTSLPEGENLLLQLLVNKVGDPSKKVASAASHALRQTLQQHPAMKHVIAREVQQLAHRPHLNARALYNCINFLNQLPLEKKQADNLAGSLMTTYFRLFDVITMGSGQNKNDKAKTSSSNSLEEGDMLQSRLLSALLTGVNRAHPFLPQRDQDLEDHMDTLYRVVHTATPSARTHALLLLFHVTVGTTNAPSNSGNDNDEEDEQAAAASRKKKPDSEAETKRKDRFYRALYSTLADPSMIGNGSKGKHLTMYFNLLYKALKHHGTDSSTNNARIMAFAKRLLATSLHCNSCVMAASIFLLNEIATKYHPFVMSCMQEVLKGPDALRLLDPSKREPRGALVVAKDNDGKSEEEMSRAHMAALWELTLTKHHYHPSVAKFSRSAMGGSNDGNSDTTIHYTGDPLRDFGLIPFLDKFSYRNPKSAERISSKYGNSKRGATTVGQRRTESSSSGSHPFTTPPVNDPRFLQQSQVDAQDEFFRKFFLERVRRDELKGIVRIKKPATGDSDEDSDDEDVGMMKAERQGALDVTEHWDDVNKGFEAWDREWETDPEEEAFVDSLAQKLMEDSMGKSGPAVLDEEDPDMDDWDDMYKDEDDDSGDSSADDRDEDVDEGLAKDEDAFMEDESSSDNSDSDNMEIPSNEEFVTSFAGNAEADEELGNSHHNDFFHLDDDEVHSGNEDNDGDEVVPISLKQGKQKQKKEKIVGTYASLEDYEDRINESWFSLKRPKQSFDEDLDAEARTAKSKRNKALGSLQ